MRSAKKLAQQTPNQARTATKLAQHSHRRVPSAKKLAQQTPNQARTATKLALHGKIRPFWPIFGALGEKYRAFYAGTRSRANFIPQTTTHQPRSAHSPVQNSPGTQRVRPQPVQNSPRTQRVRPQPVQNSPSTAKNTQISPFEASREKIIPVETRSRHKQPTQGEFYPANHHTLATLGTLTGTKLSGHTACKASTGTKLSRHCPMGRPPPKSHAIPSAPEPTTTQNVGISMIEFQSWKYSSGNCMRNCRASRKTAHKAGPVVIHRPRLVCISCISANASDYQARTERS